jgi:hypothetical protein
MMYPYITLPDEIEITYSHPLERNGQKEIEVHFEQPTENGFNTARCVLPSYIWKIKDGFSPAEISFFEQFLKNNAHLFFRYSEEGGVKIA